MKTKRKLLDYLWEFLVELPGLLGFFIFPVSFLIVMFKNLEITEISWSHLVVTWTALCSYYMLYKVIYQEKNK